MLPTYPGVLSGDRIVWSADAPPGLGAASVLVHVTLLTQPSVSSENRKRAVAALEELAARGGLASIPDPLAWEREQRTDRELPGRGE